MSALVIPGSTFDVLDHANPASWGSILTVAEMFGISLPATAGPRCGDVSSTGWTCSRAEDHTARHHSLVSGFVVAVWHQHDW